jgi:cytochrome c oxidase cbb3-type subunit III
MRHIIAVAPFLLLAAVAASAQRPAAAPPANPFQGNQAAIAEGRELYNSSCTACHGKDGASGDRGPALGAPARRYARRSDREIFDAIAKGIPGTQMPPIPMPEDNTWKVTAYIRALRGTAIDAPAPGDPAHGEQIFWGKGECGKCHMIKGKGGLMGPDLSNLAGMRKLVSIQDALTKEVHVIPGDGGTHDKELLPLSTYQPVRITTADGRVITGVLKNEDTFSLQMLGNDNALHLFERARLKEIFYIPKSLMPTDYDKRLSAPEFQNLLAFLSRLHVPAPVATGRGGGGE